MKYIIPAEEVVAVLNNAGFIIAKEDDADGALARLLAQQIIDLFLLARVEVG